MRHLEFLRTLKKKGLTPSLALEALRHPAHVSIFTRSGLQLQTRQDIDSFKDQLTFKITRRGEEELNKSDNS